MARSRASRSSSRSRRTGSLVSGKGSVSCRVKKGRANTARKASVRIRVKARTISAFLSSWLCVRSVQTAHGVQILGVGADVFVRLARPTAHVERERSEDG